MEKKYNYIDGIGKIYYVLGDIKTATAKLFSDDVVEVGASAKQEVSHVYGSNSKKATLTGAKTYDMSITLNSIQTGVLKDILGKIEDKNGMILDDSTPPAVHLQIEKSLSDGSIQYMQLLGCTFGDYEESVKTKTADGASEPVTITLTGVCAGEVIESYHPINPVTKTICNFGDLTVEQQKLYVGDTAKWGKSIIIPEQAV